VVDHDPRLAWFPVDCAGTLHPGTVSYLGGHFDGALVVACPPQNCVHRLGAALTDARLLDDRRPAIPGRIARLPVRLIHGSAADWRRILAALQELRGTALPNRNGRGAVARRGTVAVAFSVLLLTLVATGSRWPQGAEADHAVLRLGWRLAGQARERCRDLTAAELAARPVHMRQPRECVSEPLAYELRATVDGAVVAQTRVRPGGLRGDRPLMVEEDVVVRTGARPVTVTFTPEGDAPGASVLEFAGTVAFERGRVVLITHDGARLVARRR
jgi:hypothetical protein